MAILKWKSAKDWISFYIDAISLRLRRDKNLSDVFSAPECRKNLELDGENNTTHYHDNRYMPLINLEANNRKVERDMSSFCIIGDVEAAPTKFTNDMKVTLKASNVISSTSIVNDGTAYQVSLIGASSTGVQQLRHTGATADSDGNVISKTLQSGSISATIGNIGTVYANKVFNAVWNDYAEFFPRGGQTDPGDVIMLDMNHDKEQYVKATKDAVLVVGVHSEEYAMLIGGEQPVPGKEYFEANINKYIPVALSGRVHVKFVGQAQKGHKVVPSDIPGYARMYKANTDDPSLVFGYLVEADDKLGKRKLKIKVGR